MLDSANAGSFHVYITGIEIAPGPWLCVKFPVSEAKFIPRLLVSRTGIDARICHSQPAMYLRSMHRPKTTDGEQMFQYVSRLFLGRVCRRHYSIPGHLGWDGSEFNLRLDRNIS